MIIQSAEHDGVNDIAFTVAQENLSKALNIVKMVAKEVHASEVTSDLEVAKVSVIGAGITSDPQIAARIFESLANNNINIEMISTSGTRISCLINKKQIETAVKALHKEFHLEED